MRALTAVLANSAEAQARVAGHIEEKRTAKLCRSLEIWVAALEAVSLRVPP